jgi:hypothetical protein
MLEGKPLFPGKDRAYRDQFSDSIPELTVSCKDVNQFSIITELLGTPPEDVIQTICSENVSLFSSPMAATRSKQVSVDATICPIVTEKGTCTV